MPDQRVDHLWIDGQSTGGNKRRQVHGIHRESDWRREELDAAFTTSNVAHGGGAVCPRPRMRNGDVETDK